VPESDTTLNGDVLTVVSGIPAWQAPAGGSITQLTSSGGSITVTNPTGPTTNVDVAASGVTGGSYGDGSHVPQIVVGADGRITAVTVAGITGGSGTIGFEIGYAQITTSANISDTSESTATALISSGSLTFDGGPVLAEFFAPQVATDTLANGDTVTITLFEGATQIGRLAALKTINNGSRNLEPVCAHYRFTPSAGSHTYKLCAFATSTTGTPQITAGAGGTGAFVPAFLRFTKV